MKQKTNRAKLKKIEAELVRWERVCRVATTSANQPMRASRPNKRTSGPIPTFT